MARGSFLGSLSLLFIVLFNGCVAQIEQMPLHVQGGSPWKQHRYHSSKRCRLENLRAQEPVERYEAEAGVTEIWDENDEQFQCAGTAFTRHLIEPRGLLLPSYSNSPRLVYVVQGVGIQGVAIPGCPETYQTDAGRSQYRREGESQGPSVRDRHQKIRRFSAGDVLAVPAGAVQWIYNRGQSQLIVVSLYDTRSVANQLDQTLRKFYLAGHQQFGERGEWERRGSRGSSQRGSNILRAFDDDILADAFQIDTGLVRKLKESGDDDSDRIVRVDDDLEQLLPERDEEEERRERGYDREYDNGFEETICTLRLKHNIGRPDRADVFNPRGGRISTVNGHNLPALRGIRLSAERGVLYSHAIISPHYTRDSHTVMYVTRGNGRVQVVDNFGQSVFDGQLQEGQVLTIPQNFVVVKKAGDRGFEWIAFRTNDNTVTNWLAGRASQFRMLPLGVLTNSYRITREEAKRLKYNRQELAVLSPGRTEGRD